MQSLHRKHPGLVYKVSFLFAFVAAFTFLALKLPHSSTAVSLADFRPGNIISDYTMSNYTTMSVADIDAFLHAHGNCNDRDTAKASWYPHLHYHIQDGHFVCLADEVFTDGIEYGDLIPAGAKTRTAAQIIYDVAQEWKINPQVLLVLLEKEQGLISDSWPNSVQYRSATGFGCPDTAPCNEVYYGFYNQLDNAAYLFRTVLDGGWTNYPLGDNYIAYSPNAACGGSIVNVENLATSSLYRYTPYQPNAAALAAGYGTVTCGAYGNRNFFLYFTNWFGDPTITKYESTAEEILASITKVDAEATDLGFSYATYIQKLGWMDWEKGGEMAGTTGFSLRMEGLAIKLADNLKGIEYRTHIQSKGWETEYKKDGEISGAAGESLRLEAVQIRLAPELAKDYDIYYRAHVENIGWQDWVKNDEIAGTTGQSKRIEAIQAKIVKKLKTEPTLDYRAHVESIGWQDWVKNDEIAGTSGRSLRLEAIEIKLDDDSAKNYSIMYHTHVQTYGWLDWVKDGALSGTTGEGKRLEAIEIKLDDDSAKNYSIMYRTHVQTYGWLDWVKDGALSGTTGEGKRLEAIEIKLVKK